MIESGLRECQGLFVLEAAVLDDAATRWTGNVCSGGGLRYTGIPAYPRSSVDRAPASGAGGGSSSLPGGASFSRSNGRASPLGLTASRPCGCWALAQPPRRRGFYRPSDVLASRTPPRDGESGRLGRPRCPHDISRLNVAGCGRLLSPRLIATLGRVCYATRHGKCDGPRAVQTEGRGVLRGRGPRAHGVGGGRVSRGLRQ